MTIAYYNIANSNSKKLLAVVTDSEISFVKHIENLCWKTNQKLYILARVAKFMTLEKCHLVTKTLVFPNLIFVLLHGSVTLENLITNLIDCKKGLDAFYAMINAQLFSSCSRKTNQ